jgi:polysaccharide export outer membrane protein
MNIRGRILLAASLGLGMLWLSSGGAMLAQAAAPGTDAPPLPRQTLVPPTDHYILHPGDVVDITFRFTPEFNDEVTIGPDGRVVLKSLGDMRFAGYTLPEVQRAVLTGAKEKLVDPEVTVSLKDYERPHVVVAGEVQTPGKIDLRKPTTALQAILLAGGPKDDSAMGRVVVFRKVNDEFAEVHVLKLDHYKSKGGTSRNDMLLQPDDMVLVQHDKVETWGRYVKLANLGFYINPLGSVF